MYEELIKSLEQALKLSKELQKRDENYWEYEAEYYLKDDRDKSPMKILSMSPYFIDLRGTKDIEHRVCGSIDSIKERVVKIYN